MVLPMEARANPRVYSGGVRLSVCEAGQTLRELVACFKPDERVDPSRPSTKDTSRKLRVAVSGLERLCDAVKTGLDFFADRSVRRAH